MALLDLSKVELGVMYPCFELYTSHPLEYLQPMEREEIEIILVWKKCLRNSLFQLGKYILRQSEKVA